MEDSIEYWKKRCGAVESRNRQLGKEIIRLKGGRPSLSEDEKDASILREVRKALVGADKQIVWELYKEDLDNDIQTMVLKIDNILKEGH